MKSNRRSRQSGQSTVEFMLSFSVVMVAIVGVGWVFKGEWDRGRCVYLVFEKTHAAMIDAPESNFSNLDFKNRIQVEKSPTSAKGVGICNDASETVTLPKLEVDPT